MTHNHNSPTEQPEGKHNLGIAYANKQGVNYPLDNNYKEMIKSQIREAYYSGYEAASQPGESVDALAALEKIKTILESKSFGERSFGWYKEQIQTIVAQALASHPSPSVDAPSPQEAVVIEYLKSYQDKIRAVANAETSDFNKGIHHSYIGDIHMAIEAIKAYSQQQSKDK